MLDLPLPHVFSSEPAGWRVTFSAAGTMNVRLVQGGEQHVSVGTGDVLIASGEEFYLQRAA